MAEKRFRDERLRIWLTPEEKAQIEQKAAKAGYGSVSNYARKMLLEGRIVKLELTECRPLIQEMGNTNRNLHQIVYRAAKINDLHEEDYRDILKNYSEQMERVFKILSKLVGLGKIIPVNFHAESDKESHSGAASHFELGDEDGSYEDQRN